MLSQADIDSLMITIQSGKPAYVYYVAHMIEGRETDILDEVTYKGVSEFKAVKVEIESIDNAYFEYLNYLNNPDNYHIEEEEYYYHPSAKYVQCFVTPNGKDGYTKDLNPRMPSIIYGFDRKVFNTDGTFKEVKDPSPVKPIYTNVLEFGKMTIDQIDNAMKNGELDWKYMKLNSPAIVDGIEYNYITSNWYILTLKNYPMIEKPLINAIQHSGYFINSQDAFSYIDQLIA